MTIAETAVLIAGMLFYTIVGIVTIIGLVVV